MSDLETNKQETHGGWSQFNGAQKKNLIINYLPTQFTNVDLKKLFQPFGVLTSVRVITDKITKISKGFGFVSYEKIEEAEKAIQTLNGREILNKNIKVHYTRPGGCRADANLFVGNIPRDWTEKELRKVFQNYGDILDCRTLMNAKHESKRCGFVRLDSTDQAQRAIKELHGTIPAGCNHRIRVKISNSKHNYLPKEKQMMKPTINSLSAVENTSPHRFNNADRKQQMQPQQRYYHSPQTVLEHCPIMSQQDENVSLTEPTNQIHRPPNHNFNVQANWTGMQSPNANISTLPVQYVYYPTNHTLSPLYARSNSSTESATTYMNYTTQATNMGYTGIQQNKFSPMNTPVHPYPYHSSTLTTPEGNYTPGIHPKYNSQQVLISPMMCTPNSQPIWGNNLNVPAQSQIKYFGFQQDSDPLNQHLVQQLDKSKFNVGSPDFILAENQKFEPHTYYYTPVQNPHNSIADKESTTMSPRPNIQLLAKKFKDSFTSPAYSRPQDIIVSTPDYYDNEEIKPEIYTNPEVAPKTINEFCLSISNIPDFFTKKALLNLLQTYGKIQSVEIYHDQRSVSERYGFVTYFSKQDCENAIEHLNKKVIIDKTLVVQYAR